MKPTTCIYCNKHFLLELENNKQICPYCRKSQINIPNVKNLNNLSDNSIENIKFNSEKDIIIDIKKGISPTADMEIYVNSIQRRWRKYKNKKISI